MSFHVSVADVACEAGVSRQAASRALNARGETSNAPLHPAQAVIDRLEFRPSIARGPATCHTRVIGLIVPDIATPFFAGAGRGADDMAVARADDILLASLVTSPITALRVDRQAIGAAALRAAGEEGR